MVMSDGDVQYRQDLKRVRLQVLSHKQAHAFMPADLSPVPSQHILLYRNRQRLFVLTVIPAERTGNTRKALTAKSIFDTKGKRQS